MVDELFGIILDIIGEVLTSRKKNNVLKKLKLNSSYNSSHNNKTNTFDKTMGYYKKTNGSVNQTKEIKVITEILGLDRNRSILGYTENGTGKLIEINKSNY